MNRTTTRLTALAVATAFGVGPASAQDFVVFDDRAAFLAALDSILIDDNVDQFSGLELDFENTTVNTVTPGPVLTGFDAGHSGDNAITQFIDGAGLNWSLIGHNSPQITYVVDNEGANDVASFTISAGGVTAFGFDTFLLNDGGRGDLLGPEAGASMVVTATGATETFTPAANQPFFGVISNGAGDLVSVDMVLQGGVNGFEIISTDNFVGGVAGPIECIADLDGNGILNVDDVDAFVSAFLAGCP